MPRNMAQTLLIIRNNTGTILISFNEKHGKENCYGYYNGA